MRIRHARIQRATKETRILVNLNLDGSGKATVSTGIPFFDHMLKLFAKHAPLDLALRCKGDLEVDAHHSVEDCGITLGQAFLTALGEKKGIRRYGTGFDPRNPFTGSAREIAAHDAVSASTGVISRGEAYVPMDECLARCVIDFGGRPYLVWRGLDKLAHKKISPTEKRQD